MFAVHNNLKIDEPHKIIIDPEDTGSILQLKSQIVRSYTKKHLNPNNIDINIKNEEYIWHHSNHYVYVNDINCWIDRTNLIVMINSVFSYLHNKDCYFISFCVDANFTTDDKSFNYHIVIKGRELAQKEEHDDIERLFGIRPLNDVYVDYGINIT
jgi:hypothetical protein